MGRATDYSNCYIYHIVDKDGIVHYVGSTSNLNSRRSKHRYNCSHEKCKEYNFDIYMYIRDHGEFENFEIIPIRKIENISNKTELRIAENDEMKKYTGLKNMRGSYLSEEERVIQNNQKYKRFLENNPEYNKQWYEANKEKVAQQQRKYRETNREKVNEQKRQYYEANKEKISEYHRKYREQKKQLEASDQ